VIVKMSSHLSSNYTIKASLKSTVERALLAYVIHKLRKEINKCSNVKDYVDLSYSFHLKLRLPFKLFSIQPTQVKEEIVQLLNILARVRPRTLLEIGTSRGGTPIPFLSGS